jgi:hypothetical protein
MSEAAPTTVRRGGRHAGEPEVTPAVTIVFADGSVHGWAADQPQARPFLALVDLLLVLSGGVDLKASPGAPMTPFEGREHR